MFVYWPWIAIVAVLTLITAVMTLKLSRKCGMRTDPLSPRTSTNSSNYREDGELEFEMMEGGVGADPMGVDGSSINYRMQDIDAGEYSPSQAGDYPPSDYYPQSVATNQSFQQQQQQAPSRVTSPHEYAI